MFMFLQINSSITLFSLSASDFEILYSYFLPNRSACNLLIQFIPFVKHSEEALLKSSFQIELVEV